MLPNDKRLLKDFMIYILLKKKVVNKSPNNF